MSSFLSRSLISVCLHILVFYVEELGTWTLNGAVVLGFVDLYLGEGRSFFSSPTPAA